MSLNIIGARFANRVLEPVWSAEHIESIDITYDEKLGLEGRAGYYDKAGALRDMIQSHLLQVLSDARLEIRESRTTESAAVVLEERDDFLVGDRAARFQLASTSSTARLPLALTA